MLRTRILTALIALPLLIALILLAPAWCFNVVVMAITFLGLMEMASMARLRVPAAKIMIAAAGMVVAISMLIDHTGAAVSAGIVIALIGTLFGTLLTAEDMERSVSDASEILFSALYAGVLLPHFIWLRRLPDGPALVFFTIACTMGSDAGGYFAGRSFGRTKLWPSVSPKKTIEGSAGSLGGAMLIGVLFGVTIFDLFSVTGACAVAMVISVLAQVGDLMESMIKRAHDAKDSGWILPGHGGVLDRTDSLVLPVVFIYYAALAVPPG
ncbi:MAG: phosphatidate cytidylyltransferase [Hyphomicrobiaceae bacterium]|jgi:phosphatidate cytidylyltransferase